MNAYRHEDRKLYRQTDFIGLVDVSILFVNCISHFGTLKVLLNSLNLQQKC